MLVILYVLRSVHRIRVEKIDRRTLSNLVNFLTDNSVNIRSMFVLFIQLLHLETVRKEKEAWTIHLMPYLIFSYQNQWERITQERKNPFSLITVRLYNLLRGMEEQASNADFVVIDGKSKSDWQHETEEKFDNLSLLLRTNERR